MEYKFKEVEVIDGKVMVVTEKKRFLRSPLIVKFLQGDNLAGKYYKWLELPGLTLISNHISFQLDAWYSAGKK